MATTLLFNSPQPGSQFNASSTNVIATGANANTEVDQLANVNIAANTHDSVLIVDPVCTRLKVTAVIPSFANNANQSTTRVVVMIFGF